MNVTILTNEIWSKLTDDQFKEMQQNKKDFTRHDDYHDQLI